ncbi:hypothetical protein V493_04600 [Pseudogymnoascus sp. VKM F-4281 (FW-2241)]|nr:hypothetical protein V493_04600 [Pseudogymnoascus sp. VKM F-4281 (FW-2241)]
MSFSPAQLNSIAPCFFGMRATTYVVPTRNIRSMARLRSSSNSAHHVAIFLASSPSPTVAAAYNDPATLRKTLPSPNEEGR